MDCEWTLDDTCLGEDWTTYDEAVRVRATSLAVDTLRRLTAYRVGGCPITVRPVLQQDCCFIPSMSPQGFLSPGVNAAGQWVNNCGMATAHRGEVALPPPVGRVDEVKVDGAVIPPEDYRIDNGNLLVWQGEGDPPWPRNQNVNRPDSEVGTFSVTYLNGYPVTSAGAYSAGVLAYEFAKACSGKKCRLPSNVATITRQGVTMDLITGSFPGGLTGIREVDAFITLWNPQGVMHGSRVWSPDIGMRRQG